MSRIRFATARDLFETFPAVREDMEARPTDEPPLVYLSSLMGSETPEDAITFCAYMLPRHESVMWGCQCIRGLLPARTPEEEEALRAAEDWVREPEESRRRAALDVGSNGSRSTATSWLALAAGWSGGSMMPPDQPPVQAPPHLTAKAVRAAVLTALARVPVKQRRDRLKLCLQEAVRLAGADPASLRV